MHILLFIKYPRVGEVKTRLGQSVGDEHAALLYRMFVEDQLETLRGAHHALTLYGMANASAKEYLSWLGNQHPFRFQHGRDLGERMTNALASTLTETRSPVLLLGSDIPDLPPDIPDKARFALTTQDICLGPTPDGGFYLVGIRSRKGLAGLFQDIVWSAPNVLRKTMQNCRTHGLRPALLPSWPDIDTLDDLAAFMARKNAQGARTRKTVDKLSLVEPNGGATRPYTAHAEKKHGKIP